MTNDHFHRPFASLTQDRKDRKENRKDMFIGPPGQQKKVFLRVPRALRGSIFSFLTARSLRSLKIAKTAKKDAKTCLLALRANKNMQSFASFAVQSFF